MEEVGFMVGGAVGVAGDIMGLVGDTEAVGVMVDLQVMQDGVVATDMALS